MTSAGTLEWARPAVGADRGRLASLWDAAQAEVGVQRGGERLVGSISRPAELDAPDGGDAPLVADSDRLLIVGGMDGAVLGFAAACIESPPPGPVAVLQVAYVERDARGVGIGEAMLDQVVSWAETRGCTGIDAYALPGNRAAKAFFEDNGFTARLLTMYRRLPYRA